MHTLELFSDIFELDNRYSTTRRVTRDKPIIKNKPGSKVNTQLFLPHTPQLRAEGGLRKQGYFKCSKPDTPLISIITVVFNGDKYIEQTIKSVINQTYENVEYIIVDGVSTDATLEIIKKYDEKIDYWVSEPDDGMYDAMNKGISISRGSIIGILNSDDWYNFDTVTRAVEVFNLNKDVGLVHGILSLHDSNGKFKKHVAHSDFFLKRLLSTPFKHPTCFFKTSVYEQIGVFDINLKLAADYDLMLRTVKAGVKRYYIDQPLTNLRMAGVTTSTNYVSAPEEINNILQKHTSSVIVAFLFVFLRKVRSFLSILMRNK